MLISQKGKKRIFMKVIAFLTAQIFFVTSLGYAESFSKNNLRVPIGFAKNKSVGNSLVPGRFKAVLSAAERIPRQETITSKPDATEVPMLPIAVAETVVAQPLLTKLASVIKWLLIDAPLGRFTFEQRRIFQEKAYFLTELLFNDKTAGERKTIANSLVLRVTGITGLKRIFLWDFSMFGIVLKFIALINMVSFIGIQVRYLQTMVFNDESTLFNWVIGFFVLSITSYLSLFMDVSTIVMAGAYVDPDSEKIYFNIICRPDSRMMVHEFIHDFARHGLIAIDIPTASAFGTLAYFRDSHIATKFFKGGQYFFKEFKDPEERWRTITSRWLPKERAQEWRLLLLENTSQRVKRRQTAEPQWSYDVGDIMAGIAEALAEKTGRPSDAWEYLRLVALGMDPVKAESQVCSSVSDKEDTEGVEKQPLELGQKLEMTLNTRTSP